MLPMFPQESLGSILMRYGMITSRDLNQVLDLQRRRGGRLGELLLEKGTITEEMLVWCLANQLNIPCVASLELRPEFVDREAIGRLTPTLAWDLHLFPLLISDTELSVVTDDPLDRSGLAEVERLTGLTLNVAVAPPSLVRRALELYYGPREIALPSWSRPASAPGLAAVGVEVSGSAGVGPARGEVSATGAGAESSARPVRPPPGPASASGRTLLSTPHPSQPSSPPMLSLVSASTEARLSAMPPVAASETTQELPIFALEALGAEWASGPDELGAAADGGAAARVAGGRGGAGASEAVAAHRGAEAGTGAEPAGTSAAGRTSMLRHALEQFLQERLAEGIRRIRLDGHYASGWVEGGWQTLSTPGATGALLQTALLEAVEFPLSPETLSGQGVGAQLRPLQLGVLRGSVAIGPTPATALAPQAGSGLSMVVVLDAGVELPVLPENGRHQLRSLAELPGLWLLAVDDRRAFRCLQQAMRQELGPSCRVGGDEGLVLGQSCLEALSLLSSAPVVLSGGWRKEVLAYLQEGRPEMPVCLQVPVHGVSQAIQVMRAAGVSGPELARCLRGVLVVGQGEGRPLSRFDWALCGEDARKCLELEGSSLEVARLMEAGPDLLGRERRLQVHAGGKSVERAGVERVVP